MIPSELQTLECFCLQILVVLSTKVLKFQENENRSPSPKMMMGFQDNGLSSIEVFLSPSFSTGQTVHVSIGVFNIAT